MTVVVRPARLDDLDAVARFQTGTWRECYAGLVPQSYLDAQGVEERRERWRETLTTGSRDSVLAEVGGAVVGVASWVPGELRSLYVAADHRGTGLADRLLHRAIGADPARLWVFRENHRARGFYARHGFTLDAGTEQVDPGTGVPEVRLSRP